MLRVLIWNNDTGSDSSANYEVDVLINATPLAKLEIKGHNRKDGWIKLLEQIVEVAKENEKLLPKNI